MSRKVNTLYNIKMEEDEEYDEECYDEDEELEEEEKLSIAPRPFCKKNKKKIKRSYSPSGSPASKRRRF